MQDQTKRQSWEIALPVISFIILVVMLFQQCGGIAYRH